MGGSDGSLYELEYQADEGWFSKRARKINHTRGIMSALTSYWSAKPAIIDIVIDESRNILYTLSARGAIEVYDLGTDGLGFQHVAAMSNVIASAETLCPRLKFTQIGKEASVKSIAVIPKSESKYLTLVAISSSALRLYFSALSLSGDAAAIPSQRPTKLELIHIRFPPDLTHEYTKVTEAGGPLTPVRPAAYEAAARTPRAAGRPFGFDVAARRQAGPPYNIDTTYYSQGVVLLGQSVGERDEVVAIKQTIDQQPSATQTGDLIISRPLLLEKATKTEVAGKIWAIDEKPPAVFLAERLRLIPIPAPGLTPEERGEELSLWCDETGQWPMLRIDLAVQHALPPRHFFFLTNTALHTLVMVRPIDQLYRILAESGGHLTHSIESFEMSYGSVETCAMYLILATAPRQRSFWTLGVPIDPTVASYATQLFFNHPEQPEPVSTFVDPVMGQLITDQPIVKFSGKHRGLSLYLARLLKPLWNRLVLDIDRINQLELADLKSMLLALQQFLEDHPAFAPIPADLRAGRRKGIARLEREDRMDEEEAIPGETAYARKGLGYQARFAGFGQGEPEKSAQRLETESISNMHLMLRRSIEMTEFLHIVGENKFIGVFSLLPQLLQDRLQRMRFSDMLTTSEGFELTRALIDALMSAYKDGKGDQASVEAISQKLRTSCPTIFREEDRIRHKADELLYKAKQSRNPREREDLLEQSLELYRAVAVDLVGEPNQDHAKLRHVCENYLYLRFYAGVLKLALACAKAADPKDYGLAWYKDHYPPLGQEAASSDDDSVGAKAYETRLACYHYVLSAIAELLLAQAPAFECIPFEELERRPADDAETVDKRALVLQMALLDEDELFHEMLYRWFISPAHTVDLSSTLLGACIQLDSPFIEGFLLNTNSALLPNYYIRKGQYEKAALAYQEMAFNTEGLDLEQRIDYLSKAKIAAQSAAGRGELLSRVKDALDIAQVQSKVLQELDVLPAARAITPDEKEKRIRGREELRFDGLKDINTLYNVYISPLGLWESGLYAFKVSSHVDEALTKRFWRSIVNEELHKMQATGLNLESLRGKIVSLGQALERDENVFPVEWICGYLEVMMGNDLRQYADNDYGWVPRVMKEVGFGLPVLFEIYHNALYEENNPDWAEFASRVGRPTAKLEALKVQHWIVSEWMQDLNNARDAQRRLLVAAATASGVEERLGEYIRALANQRSEDARKLSQSFVDLQTLLDRLTYHRGL
jgi:nuclear pore complex protein Nup155